jgi:diaminohydroxyphosphoribosylaminopyrimidine deaminase/5-amino-6-(5-phosphoribosylamino)uracil reductase
MSLTPQDELHLTRALALAQAAAAFASPNPTVGCVLTRDGQTLGEGAHYYDTLDHAEIVALKQAAAQGHSVHGATAYVTLEPCSFHGRTGPCSDALISSGITRCVIATVDPHPRVSGSGIAKLIAAGVETILASPQFLLAQQARRLNDAFAFSAQHNRPFVTLKAAISLDGKLAPPPSQRTCREPFWLTGPVARADVQQLRHANDAILTGIGTILADNPSLTDRTNLPRRRPLLRVVLDTHLRLPPDSQIVAPNLLIVTTAGASHDREQQLTAQGAELLHTSTDPTALLETLHHRQIRSVLLEAGPTLNAAFLAANLVDRVVLYISETELGTDALPFATGRPSPYVLQQHLSSLTRQTFPHAPTEDVRITGYLHDPWSNI